MATEENSKMEVSQKEEIQNKLKEKISEIFNQILKGCNKKNCYNFYCAKNKISEIEFKSKEKKEILIEAVKLIQNGEYTKVKCIENSEIISISEMFDKFLIDPNYCLWDEIANKTYQLPKLNFNLKANLEYTTQMSKQDDNLICSDVIKINKLYTTFIQLITKENTLIINNFSINIVYFLYSFMIKGLCCILLNPSFALLNKQTKDFSSLFKNYRQIKKYAKNVLKYFLGEDPKAEEKISSAYMSSLSEFKNYENEFKSIIANAQNFLTCTLFSIGSNNNEEGDKGMFLLLSNFIKTFKTFHSLNERLHLVSDKDFFNDGLSKHLNFKRECKIYLENLKVKKGKKKEFCVINYIWLFDPAAKSDILSVFNQIRQTNVIFSSIGNLEALNGPIPQLIDATQFYFFLKVRRNNLIEDTLNAVANPDINLQKPLKVKFENEQGVDEGGVKKEFFMLLVRQLFDANYGMFSYNDKTRLFWFNLYTFESKIKFELIGIILGLALFNNVILDVKFPIAIYKKLLDIPTTLEDMKECDPELFQTFTYLKNTKESNLKEKLSTNFTVIVDKLGEKEVIPLKEGGENIFIDENNKDEYVDLYLDWYFNKSIELTFSPFKKGFYRVCDHELAKLIKPDELELIICGIQQLDFVELERSAKYEDGYEPESKTCKLLWEVLHSFTEEEKKKFLFFVTGCDRAPINGLGSLVITISRFGPDSDKLPCAHTCFNHLLLPDYQNKEKLLRCLHVAINNSEGFGLI